MEEKLLEWRWDCWEVTSTEKRQGAQFLARGGMLKRDVDIISSQWILFFFYNWVQNYWNGDGLMGSYFYWTESGSTVLASGGMLKRDVGYYEQSMDFFFIIEFIWRVEMSRCSRSKVIMHFLAANYASASQSYWVRDDDSYWVRDSERRD